LLRPDTCSLLNDLHEITATMNLSNDDQISIEQKLLVVLSNEPGSHLGALCLDPSPVVAYTANQLHFQKNKWALLNKKKAIKRSYYETNPTSSIQPKSAEPSRFRLLQYLHQKSQLENQPTGEESGKYSFAMEVHKLLNQTINDQLCPPGREREKNQVPDHSDNPTDLINQIVDNILQQTQTTDGPSAAPPALIPFNRKLKFHLTGGKSFCVIQVHSKRGSGYEAVLRVGKLPDSGTNGDVVRFPIGNTESAEKLIAQMKTLYEREGFGTLIYDSKNDTGSVSQQPQSSTQIPPAYGFSQNAFASQSQQNLPTQNALTNPTIPTMTPNQPQAMAGLSQTANVPTTSNPPFTQLQGASNVGYNLPPNVGISNISAVGNAPFQLLGSSTTSANSFNQIAMAQKFGGAYVSQLKGRSKSAVMNLPPGAAPNIPPQHQVAMGMSMPLGANQIMVNPNTPSGFPIQPNSGTGNVLLRLSNQLQNTPQQNSNPQQNAK